MHENLQSLICKESGVRLDSFLSQAIGFSRTRVALLIQEELVLVNGRLRNKNFVLSVGDVITFSIPPEEEIEAKPEEIPLDVAYEDRDIIVVNKPQGMVVHPAPGNYRGTLVNALLFHCRDSLSGINGKLRPGIVHRIDKDTSGLVVAAKNDAAHTALAKMFKDHSFVRKYQAIVYGSPKSDIGSIHLAIGRSKKDRKKMAFYPTDTPNTKNAITHYQVLENTNGYSLLSLHLETGRTHQIRVHMKYLGFPLIGDHLYNPDMEAISRQALHAYRLAFTHPITREPMEFTAPLPEDMRRALGN